MLRIFITEYDIDPVTNWGTKCGPNIEAPSEAIAAKVCRGLRSKYGKDLRIQGELIAEIPCVVGFSKDDPSTWVPDWSRMVDYEDLRNN